MLMARLCGSGAAIVRLRRRKTCDGRLRVGANQVRDYEPGTGRYVESDPAGLLGGLSTYSYVGSHPYISADKYGLVWVCKDPAEIPWETRFFTSEYTETKSDYRVFAGMIIAPQGMPTGFVSGWERLRGRPSPTPMPSFNWRIFFLFAHYSSGTVYGQLMANRLYLQTCEDVVEECGTRIVVDSTTKRFRKLEEVGSKYWLRDWDYLKMETEDMGAYYGPTP